MPTAAIVVAYHPDAGLPGRLARLRPQLDALIVVDNGSPAATVQQLAAEAARVGFILIANRDNLGVAAALNLGIERAIAEGAEWLLLFDQDSTMGEDFSARMYSCHAHACGMQRVAIAVPRYVDPDSGRRLAEHRLPDGSLATAITSGSLLSVATYRSLGPFAEELFIDSVDHEYALRARRAGYKLIVCEDAVLFHALGSPRRHTVLGVFQFHSTNYSPIRRYYQERNKIWLYRRYLLSFPGFCASELLRSLVDLAKLLLVEDEKARKMRFFLRGVWHGLRNRMGPYRGF